MAFGLKFFLVMLSMILADIAWTYYFIKVDERHSLSAGMWASLIICFGAFTTISYIADARLFFAAVLGSFIGTVIAVEFKRKQDKNKKDPQ
jgi:hypothetical protein